MKREITNQRQFNDDELLTDEAPVMYPTKVRLYYDDRNYTLSTDLEHEIRFWKTHLVNMTIDI